MTVVPAKMIMGENEPRSRARRAPAVGPPSSDLNEKKKQIISNRLSRRRVKIKIKMSCTSLGFTEPKYAQLTVYD